ADLSNLVGALPGYALPGARWFLSNYALGTVFARLAASAGGILVRGNELIFMGFPITLTQVLPASSASQNGKIMLLFGNMSQACTLGDRRTIGLRMSDQRYLENDQVGFLGTERIDIVNHDLGDNTTAGPIVGLAGTT